MHKELFKTWDEQYLKDKIPKHNTTTERLSTFDGYSNNYNMHIGLTITVHYVCRGFVLTIEYFILNALYIIKSSLVPGLFHTLMVHQLLYQSLIS